MNIWVVVIMYAGVVFIVLVSATVIYALIRHRRSFKGGTSSPSGTAGSNSSGSGDGHSWFDGGSDSSGSGGCGGGGGN